MPCTLDNMIALLEKACNPERRHLHVHNVTEEDLRAAFAAFQNRCAELARINSLSVSGCLLPALSGLLEPEGVERIELASGDSQSHWPFLEKYRNLAELKIVETANIPESIGNLQSLTVLTFDRNENLTTLPDSIGNLKNLVSLRICGSPIERLPENIASLTKLTRLSLCRNMNQIALPDSIARLASLEIEEQEE